MLYISIISVVFNIFVSNVLNTQVKVIANMSCISKYENNCTMSYIHII